MAAVKYIAIALAIFLAVSVQARELRADRTVSNCKEYGIKNNQRVCTKCSDDHILVPGGLECQKRIAGCKDVGFQGGKQVCKACEDSHVLIPGGMSCNRKVVGGH